jgi:hypothetical protein
VNHTVESFNLPLLLSSSLSSSSSSSSSSSPANCDISNPAGNTYGLSFCTFEIRSATGINTCCRVVNNLVHLIEPLPHIARRVGGQAAAESPCRSCPPCDTATCDCQSPLSSACSASTSARQSFWRRRFAAAPETRSNRRMCRASLAARSPSALLDSCSSPSSLVVVRQSRPTPRQSCQTWAARAVRSRRRSARCVAFGAPRRATASSLSVQSWSLHSKRSLRWCCRRRPKRRGVASPDAAAAADVGVAATGSYHAPPPRTRLLLILLTACLLAAACIVVVVGHIIVVGGVAHAHPCCVIGSTIVAAAVAVPVAKRRRLAARSAPTQRRRARRRQTASSPRPRRCRLPVACAAMALARLLLLPREVLCSASWSALAPCWRRKGEGSR